NLLDRSAFPNSVLFGLQETKSPMNKKILKLITIFFNLCTTVNCMSSGRLRGSFLSNRYAV
ncbi:hypothetical protein, partial [Aequorivita sp. 609]|uniref:hypothetical protein n=1 Tax=Aequorivita sp. 609 TaxID=2760087 RepID=UPI001C86B2FD